MFLSEGIINNFIEAIDDSDMAKIEHLDDNAAYQYLAGLYRKNYGADPSGAAVYLLRNKFNIGTEEFNRRFIPRSLL
jgi:hypothetical protein